MEKSCVAGTLNEQLHRLKRLSRSGAFLKDSQLVQVDEFPNAIFANAMQVWRMSLHVGDVVFHENTAGKLVACAIDDGVCYGIVEMFQEESSVSDSASIWRVNTMTHRVIPAQELQQALRACAHGPSKGKNSYNELSHKFTTVNL